MPEVQRTEVFCFEAGNLFRCAAPPRPFSAFFLQIFRRSAAADVTNLLKFLSEMGAKKVTLF
jgi:hypothetical protein